MNIKFKKHYRVELAKTLTGHWYHVWEMISGKEKYLGVHPSSTTILLAYPQSEQLTKWIADQGWQESQAFKSEKGRQGTKIHTACDNLEMGVELHEGDFALEEWWKLTTFSRWHKEYRPKLLEKEISVFSKRGKYAGRLDRIYDLDGKIIILDFKSSSNIHKHFPLQFSSYAKAIEEISEIKVDSTAVLQLGASNQNGYRFEMYPDWKDHYKVFESVRSVWQYDYFDSKKKKKDPPVLDVPKTLKLDL